VNDFAVDDLVEAFHVWNVQLLDGLDHHAQSLVSAAALVQSLTIAGISRVGG
jgi:hypothetical protein